MIKVMNLVALILAPIVVQFDKITPIIFIVVVVAVGLILWSVRRSDRDEDTIEESKPIQA
jgi:4-hydroxybenzoate polyprenyltransferase